MRTTDSKRRGATVANALDHLDAAARLAASVHAHAAAADIIRAAETLRAYWRFLRGFGES